jgi:Ni/Co efflux regulator RcnB
VAHGTDVLDIRRSACRHTPFLRSRKCCLLFYKKNLIELSARLLLTLMAQTGTEVDMAESSQPGSQAAKQAEPPIEDNRRDNADDRNRARRQPKLPNHLAGPRRPHSELARWLSGDSRANKELRGRAF